MKLEKLVKLLDETLELGRFKSDASNNGLQLEASQEVKKIAFAVDGCALAFEKAIELEADLLVVHHGISWGSAPKRFTGVVAERLGTLLGNGLSLYAAHLPLDAHPKYGNNAQLAEIAGLKNCNMFFEYDGVDIGVIGKAAKVLPLRDLAAIFEDKLDTKGKIHGDPALAIEKIAIVSGGGGREALEAASEAGADLLVTGEFDHQMYHLQLELGIPVLSLGHYASETVGVRSLAEFLAETTKLKCVFIDIPTGL